MDAPAAQALQTKREAELATVKIELDKEAKETGAAQAATRVKLETHVEAMKAPDHARPGADTAIEHLDHKPDNLFGGEKGRATEAQEPRGKEAATASVESSSSSELSATPYAPAPRDKLAVPATHQGNCQDIYKSDETGPGGTPQRVPEGDGEVDYSPDEPPRQSVEEGEHRDREETEDAGDDAEAIKALAAEALREAK